jgi:hypothetical protein
MKSVIDLINEDIHILVVALDDYLQKNSYQIRRKEIADMQAQFIRLKEPFNSVFTQVTSVPFTLQELRWINCGL